MLAITRPVYRSSVTGFFGFSPLSTRATSPETSLIRETQKNGGYATYVGIGIDVVSRAVEEIAATRPDDLLTTAENEGNGPDRGRTDAAVSYVDGEFPLYHRDWKRVFGDRGLAQLIREPTFRVFRAV
jgi:hypothetical protein